MPLQRPEARPVITPRRVLPRVHRVTSNGHAAQLKYILLTVAGISAGLSAVSGRLPPARQDRYNGCHRVPDATHRDTSWRPRAGPIQPQPAAAAPIDDDPHSQGSPSDNAYSDNAYSTGAYSTAQFNHPGGQAARQVVASAVGLLLMLPRAGAAQLPCLAAAPSRSAECGPSG